MSTEVHVGPLRATGEAHVNQLDTKLLSRTKNSLAIDDSEWTEPATVACKHSIACAGNGVIGDGSSDKCARLCIDLFIVTHIEARRSDSDAGRQREGTRQLITLL